MRSTNRINSPEQSCPDYKTLNLIDSDLKILSSLERAESLGLVERKYENNRFLLARYKGSGYPIPRKFDIKIYCNGKVLKGKKMPLNATCSSTKYLKMLVDS